MSEVSCEACGPVEFRSDTQCDVGGSIRDGACAAGASGTTTRESKCLACPSLQHRLPGTNTCVPCAPGEVFNTAGTCSRCPAGTVTTDGLVCSSCPPGTGANSTQTACVSCSADLSITLVPSCDPVVVNVPISHPGDECPGEAWVDVVALAANLGWGVEPRPAAPPSAALCPQTSVSLLALAASDSRVLADKTSQGVSCLDVLLCEGTGGSCSYGIAEPMPPNVSARIRLTSSASLAASGYQTIFRVPPPPNACLK